MDPPISPMLATTGAPPTGPGWAYEIKHDGQRCIATIVEGGQLRLSARPRDPGRPGNNITDTYPELRVLADVLYARRSVVLDGEIVVLDDQGRPRLGLVQHRINANPDPRRVRRYPAIFYAFDVLEIDGRMVRRETYDVRRALLCGLDLNGKSPHVRVPPSFTDADGVDGWSLLTTARLYGLEGIVAKWRDSKYLPGYRSPQWRKAKVADHPILTTGEMGDRK